MSGGDRCDGFPPVVSLGNPQRQKRKKPAAGGGAAGFQYRSSDWEEECRCSCKQPWEEEWAASAIEVQREEVHPFDKYDYK